MENFYWAGISNTPLQFKLSRYIHPLSKPISHSQWARLVVYSFPDKARVVRVPLGQAKPLIDALPEQTRLNARISHFQ
jgi:hypothetical protein